MHKTVKLKDTITPERIGCRDHEHFKKYLSGNLLLVLEEDTHAVLIQDTAGEQFYILKADLKCKGDCGINSCGT